MYCDNVIIEITRRCNMTCLHCLRGDQQNVDIPLEYIDTLFEKIDYISHLTITGGEPSLKPRIIDYIVESAKKNNVDIGGFYIATNGKKVSDEFLLSLIRLHNFCTDNEISEVKISYDDYHDRPETREEEAERDKLSVFSFVRYEANDPHYTRKQIINEGNAVYNGIGTREKIKPEVYVSYEDNEINEGQIYLNCKGNIINDCDLSYKNQDEEENIVCNVKDFSFQAIKDFSLQGA